MSFIYCDSVIHDIIDILPYRRKHKLETYILKFSRKQRECCKWRLTLYSVRRKSITSNLYFVLNIVQCFGTFSLL